MMLIPIIEGAVVFWMSRYPLVHASSASSLGGIGLWMGLALPQGWLLAASLVLICRVTAVLIPPTRWTDREFLHNRQAFVRMGCPAMALVARQGILILIGNPSAAS